MEATSQPQALRPRVLVPILVIGGLLCIAQIMIPGTVRASSWAMTNMACTALVTWAIAGWVSRRGVSRKAMFVMCLWADYAIAAGALSQHDLVQSRTTVAMFALPSVMAALYGSIAMLGAQAAVAAGGCVVILAWSGLTPPSLIVDVVAALLATISPALAVVILRRRLDQALLRERELSSHDPLTHMTNRRGLEAAIPDLLTRSRATELPIGLAVIDVDHFKQVNDRYGHQAGDAVLQQISALLKDCVRGGDLVCRLGGEEFAVLAVITPDHLATLGERIRATIEQHAPYQVTVSVGATWEQLGTRASPTDTERVWALLDRADELMYDAKRDGRNRMHIATAAPVA